MRLHLGPDSPEDAFGCDSGVCAKSRLIQIRRQGSSYWKHTCDLPHRSVVRLCFKKVLSQPRGPRQSSPLRWPTFDDSPAFTMNIFRLAGDVSHLAAIIILLLKIWKTRSCAGISGGFRIQINTLNVLHVFNVIIDSCTQSAIRVRHTPSLTDQIPCLLPEVGLPHHFLSVSLSH